jgi:hypothetical protein
MKDEKGNAITYWGGLEEPKQELHTCKYCGAETTQPDDECYAKPQQNKVMRIDDINEMADADIRENERLEKLAEEVYGKGVVPDYEEGFTDGYNKAKETLEDDVENLAGDYALNRGISKGIEQRMIDSFVAGYNKAREKYNYTDEDIIKAIDMARLQGNESFLVKYREEDIIQSLKLK